MITEAQIERIRATHREVRDVKLSSCSFGAVESEAFRKYREALIEEFERFISAASILNCAMPSKDVDAVWHAVLASPEAKAKLETAIKRSGHPQISHIECRADEDQMERTRQLIQASFPVDHRRAFWKEAAKCNNGNGVDGSL